MDDEDTTQEDIEENTDPVVNDVLSQQGVDLHLVEHEDRATLQQDIKDQGTKKSDLTDETVMPVDPNTIHDDDEPSNDTLHHRSM